MAKLTVKDVDLKGKKVLVRVDFNVPLKDGVITNDNRISAALPTIKYILEQGGRAVLFSHLGRVKEEADKEGKSLAPVAANLAEKLGQDVVFIPAATRGAELEAAINALEDGQVLLVENTRFDATCFNCKYNMQLCDFNGWENRGKSKLYRRTCCCKKCDRICKYIAYLYLA